MNATISRPINTIHSTFTHHRKICKSRWIPRSSSHIKNGASSRAMYRAVRTRASEKEQAKTEERKEELVISWLDRLEQFSDKVSQYFAVTAAGALCIGLMCPSAFQWFNGHMVSSALGISMLAMGCTLNLEDFAIVAQYPFRLLAGIALQYTIMPLAGFCISRMASLPHQVAAGVILVSCCPGGVASNVVTFLAQGDVALSIAMTSVSTILAIGMTPFLTTMLIGTLIPVDGWALLLSTLQVIMIPLILGLGLKTIFPKFTQRFQKIAPLLAIIAIFLINVSITAQNAQTLYQSALTMFVCALCLHATGFSLGYILSRLLKFPRKTCITVSIEVGMQNSGLGAVLATRHFQDPLSPCFCVLSACLHSFMGGLLATWSRNQNQQNVNNNN